MDLVYIGKLINTHGIKGEVRILSDFEKKSSIFKKGFKLYLGNNMNEFTISTYRVHKNYDMVTFDRITNINEIISFKGTSVYINKKDLNMADNEFLYSDLINLEVYENEVLLGKVVDYMYNKSDILLSIAGKKKFYIPYVDEYIINVDIKNNKINVKNTKGLII